MNSPTTEIYVAPLSTLPPDMAREAARRIADTFSTPAEVLPVSLDTSAAFDAQRGQYNSTRILAGLLERCPSGGRILGLTDFDLFIPVLTFVFGEAQLDGTAAVVSTHRLHNEFYGLPPDEVALRARLFRESVHELGHAFGLKHCLDFRCVMHASTSVEEIDLKGDDFCRACRALLSSD